MSYLRKLTNITIPALLAPGNLPTLVKLFDVEVVLITEQDLFPIVRRAPAFKNLSKLCRVELRPLDDLLTGASGDYGVVLSYALYRGFVDLGPRMTDTYLLFLNADFIISDGSYTTLARLMQEGHRVIHCPSFRVVLEDVLPVLERQVDPTTTSLRMSPRDMVHLALAHRHLTVKARTVNQRLCHQWRMDQYYWFVNEDTLICYQWPVALVAIKPECVLTEPTLMWDYAFVPDAAPTLPRYFISDSDDFFMLEPQQRTSGQEMIRVGWISPDEIATDLSAWTTREQRECGQQLLIFHASELPDRIGDIIAESKAYIHDITRRLSPTPQSHLNHTLFKPWFDQVQERIRAGGGVATGSLLQEYRSFGASVAVMPTDPKLLTPEHGAGMIGVGFLSRSALSFLRIHAAVNAYSDTDNEVVLAIFRNGQREPLKVAVKPIAANERILIESLFDLQLGVREVLGIEVRIGPARPGTIYINGPQGHVPAPPPDMPVPYLSIIDLSKNEDAALAHADATWLQTTATNVHPLPTGSRQIEYPFVSTVSKVLPNNPTEATADDGSSMLGYSFVPRNSQSVLRINIVANAYSSVDNEVAIAVFCIGQPIALRLVSKPVAAGESVEFDLSFEMIPRIRGPIGLQVNIGPVRLGEITINGPEGSTVANRRVPFISLVDLGDIGISSASPSESQSPAEKRFGWSLPLVRLLTTLPSKIARSIYSAFYGRLPQVKMGHPLWLDTHHVAERLSAVRHTPGARIFWVGSGHSLFERWLPERINPGLFDSDALIPAHIRHGQFDICFCDLNTNELPDFRSLYYKIRPYVKDGGSILLYVYNNKLRKIKLDNFELFDSIFPDSDGSNIAFFGAARNTLLNEALLQASESSRQIGRVHMLIMGLRLLTMTPWLWLSNLAARRRDPSKFLPNWTSMVAEFQVLRHQQRKMPPRAIAVSE